MDSVVIGAIVTAFATIAVAGIGGFRAGQASKRADKIAEETLDLSTMQATVATFKTLGEAQGMVIEQLQGRVNAMQARLNYYEEHWEPKAASNG